MKCGDCRSGGRKRLNGTMHAESVLHARVLRLHFLIQEAQAEALLQDHLDESLWDVVGPHERPGRESQRGGVLWCMIDENHAKMMMMVDRAFP